MRRREFGCNQLLILSAFLSVIPNWKAGCYIKPKHQPHLKVPEPNVGSIKSLLASLRNQKVESRACAQASLLALLFGRRSAPDTDTDTDTDTHPFARTCSLGVGKHAKQKWYKLCNPYVRKAKHREGMALSRVTRHKFVFPF